MPGKRRSKSQLVRDRRRIADLYLAGRTQIYIAEELDLSQSTISNDLQALQKEWRESALVDLDKAKAKELARIDRLERAYWREWEKSKKDKEVVIKKGVRGASGERNEATKREEGQRGDPRYLSGVQWCIEQRCKILGIYAAAKHELTGKDGGPIKHKLTAEEMSDDDLANIAAGGG